MLVTDPQALNELIDSARSSLFRLETLDRYDDGSDGSDFARYMAGEPGPDPERKARWHKVLQADLDRMGKRTRRVHIVRSPLSDYLRYEFEWGYAHNLAYEDIRILDLAEHRAPRDLEDLLIAAGDFWFIDGRAVAAMGYDDAGRWVCFEKAAAEDLPSFMAIAQMAWRAGVPFAEWWDNHRQYHRASRVAA